MNFQHPSRNRAAASAMCAASGLRRAGPSPTGGFINRDQLRERNEVLDCRVYARAAAWIAGADRWSGAKWRGLEEQLGPAPGQTDGHRAGDEPAPVTGTLARAPRATGTRRSTWLALDKGWWK